MGLEGRTDSAGRGVIQVAEVLMIDNPLQADLLVAKLKAALPLPATATPPLLAQLQEQRRAVIFRP